MYLSKIARIPFDVSTLLRIRATKSQSAGIEKRLSNVRNAFNVSNTGISKIYNKNILLLDDVFTTGATVNECAKTLKQNGAKTVNVITIARV